MATLLLCTTAAVPPVGAAAQEPVVEEQVPLDVDGRLMRVEPDLARALGLFGDLTGVREILLFRSADGYVLEITRRRGGVLVRERRRLSEAEVEAFRREVSARLAERAPAAVMDRSGRYLLLGTSTVAGLGFYGWAVPYALNVEDTRGQVGLYMLVASASFFGPWIWSAERPVTLGMANAAFWGASRGIVHGFALHTVLAGDEPGFAICDGTDPTCFERDREERDRWWRTRVLSGLALSLGEGIGGLAWAKALRMTAGDAHLIGVVSDFGAAGAVSAGALFAGDDLSDRAAWSLILGGAAGGIGAGTILRSRRDYSWGDAEVFRAAGLLGAYTGITAADITGTTESRVFAGLGLAGGLAGTVLGDRLVRERDLGAGQGLLVDLGTVAGGLLGIGIAVLVAGDDATETLPLVLSTLGAWTGFGVTFASLEDREPGGRGEGAGGAGGGAGSLPFRLDLVPFPDAARGVGSTLPPLAVRMAVRF